MTFSSILAPVDFSDDSVQGARLAAAIARRHSATLTLMHVDGLPVYSDQVARAAAPDQWVRYLIERDEALQERLREFAWALEFDQPVDVAVARGDATKAIAAHSAERASDLIVISPSGRGYGQRFLLGSVSAQLAEEAACPVLVARARAASEIPERGTFSSILVAVSDAKLAEHALGVTSQLAEPATEIQLVHVLESFEITLGPPLPGDFHEALEQVRRDKLEELERLAGPLREQGFTTNVRVETGDPSFSILCRVEQNPNHLVVVARKRRPVGRGALSTSAFRMVKHCPVPVLVVPGPA